MLAKIIDIWVSGGWVMIPLALLAVLIFVTGFHLVFFLRGDAVRLGDSTAWFDWVRNPAGAEPRFAHILSYVTENVSTSGHIQNRFEEIRQSLIRPVDQRLVFLGVLIAVAPLMGLFGTVLGMLGIFDALAAGGGGKETTGLVAHGIS
ncbi:MAG: MotA/TolQ/ExbB proton channel family protein, partial [Verrucomicrobiota bacterium]